ncbi:hypothetical protein [Methylocaldum gracile]|jgi:hypothetical protein|uniref:hypothetical protein n=1 Tax=Methylocaldum sp. 0917 TaxID=2485163 RepID=UPI0014152760
MADCAAIADKKTLDFLVIVLVNCLVFRSAARLSSNYALPLAGGEEKSVTAMQQVCLNEDLFSVGFFRFSCELIATEVREIP